MSYVLDQLLPPYPQVTYKDMMNLYVFFLTFLLYPWFTSMDP